MVRAPRDARAFLVGINEDAFRASLLHRYAVTWAFEIMAQAAEHLSPSVREKHADIPWHEIRDLHEHLAHGNDALRQVWIVMTERLEPLMKVLAPVAPDGAGAAG